jgi:hypothetical protein
MVLRKRTRPTGGGRQTENGPSTRIQEENADNERLAQLPTERIQLYLPSGIIRGGRGGGGGTTTAASVVDVDDLFEGSDWTDQNLFDFCAGHPLPVSPRYNDKDDHENDNEKDDDNALWFQKFQARHAEIRHLSRQLVNGSGGARIDSDGRLVPVTGPPEPPRANLPPPPAMAPHNNNNHHDHPPPRGRRLGGAAAVVGDNQNVNNNNIGGGGNNREEENPQEQRWILEQETQDAEASIARAMERYRIQQVPLEELELILIPPGEILGNGANHPAPRGGNRNNPHDGMPNLTLRRICIAALAVVTAFVAVILQTLPLLQPTESLDPNFDKLLQELLLVKELYVHAQHCPGLHRRTAVPEVSSWHTRTKNLFGKVVFGPSSSHASLDTPTSACDDGVLHIPSRQVLLGTYLQSAKKEEAKRLRPFATGVNVSWFLPCQPIVHFSNSRSNNQAVHNFQSYSPFSFLFPNFASMQSSNEDLAPPTLKNTTTTCDQDDVAAKTEEGRSDVDYAFHAPSGSCFRGVHDGMISEQEVESALRMGNILIVNGGDHFDIHYDTSHLEHHVPSIVEKLTTLLQTTYHVIHEDQQFHLQPVAFRVNTVGPMDGHGVNLYRPPASTLNRTVSATKKEASMKKGGRAKGNLTLYLRQAGAGRFCRHNLMLSFFPMIDVCQQRYLQWMEKCKRRNDVAWYNLPWPFYVAPVRDTCNLMSDMEADPQFAIHTTVFLNDGAGMGYRGGVALYVDHHPDNENPKRRIRRGVSIDGSGGRVVVSTGGMENRRCRLPTRAGLRTALQIWWTFVEEEN